MSQLRPCRWARDLIMDVATEEMGHVEMIATMVARLLEAGTSWPAAIFQHKNVKLADVAAYLVETGELIGSPGPGQ